MAVLRLVKEGDLAKVLSLAEYAGVGLTTLPANEGLLKYKIQDSCRSVVYPPDKPRGESFLFVLEDNDEIIGTSAVYTKVGGFEPFWTYKVRSKRICSKTLGVKKKIKFLRVKKEHSGPSEIGTLFLHPQKRKSNYGRLLSLGRFLFIAEYRGFFEDLILAEMRGRIDADGRSPFWDCVGSHFFDVSLEKADLMVNTDKSFIDDLFPRHPIYIPMLTTEAQSVIGQVHDKTAPAKYLLETEGFRLIDEVDIFEAGPILQAKTDQIRAVAQSRSGIFCEVGESVNDDLYMVAVVNDLASFRIGLSQLSFSEEGLVLPVELVRELELKPNDKLRLVKLR